MEPMKPTIKLRKTPLREDYEFLRLFEKEFAKLDGETRKVVSGHIDKQKRKLRQKSRLGNDPLEKPLTEDWRRVFRHDGETMVEFRIYPGNWDDMLDEEIEEEVRSLELHNFSPYDCTGKLFTAWLTWKRVEVGLSVCHCMALDI